MDESVFTPPRNQILLPEFIDDFFFCRMPAANITPAMLQFMEPPGENRLPLGWNRCVLMNRKRVSSEVRSHIRSADIVLSPIY